MAPLAQLPSDRPEVEYFDGLAHPKMSPQWEHGRLQVFLARALEAQGCGFGETVTEWRCRVDGVRKSGTVLIPDVAFASGERLRGLSRSQGAELPFAPDIAVEILSPGDRRPYLRKKIARYLETGAIVVIEVDPKKRTVVAHTRDGSITFREGEAFAHPAVAWFSFDILQLFASANWRWQRLG